MRGDLAGNPLADVSRETLERLEALAELVRKWTGSINLVSRASLADIWVRHIVDSAQLFRAAPKPVGRWLDLGSGAGFPGLVCAILAAEGAAAQDFTLVESDGRKAAFLATAARSLSVSVTIFPRRIEDIPPHSAQIISARALAPLPGLLDLAARHLAPSGVALFPKGASVDGEIRAAQELWRFKLDRIASITDANATLLRIGDLHRG